MNKKQKLELTWIGKERRPRLGPRILLEDLDKSYHAPHRATDNRLIFGDNLLASFVLRSFILAKKRNADTTKNALIVPFGEGEVLLYQTADGLSRIEVHVVNETVWLSLNEIAKLFQRDKSVISRHVRNVFDEGKLQPE